MGKFSKEIEELIPEWKEAFIAYSNLKKQVKEDGENDLVQLFREEDEVVTLMDDVESIFTKQFANNDRKKAMKFLKPQQQKESHMDMVTFFIGFLTGAFVSLFSVYPFLAHSAGIFKPNSEKFYVETIYSVFSVFGLLSLHLLTYGCNLFMWKNTRINYNYIFGFFGSYSTRALEFLQVGK